MALNGYKFLYHKYLHRHKRQKNTMAGFGKGNRYPNVYLVGPRGSRTGRRLNGYHYTLTWTEGYSGPHSKGPGFARQILTKIPPGTRVISEDDFFQTEVGLKTLMERERAMNGYTERAADMGALQSRTNSRVQKELEARYRLRKRMGLLDEDLDIWDTIDIALDDERNRGQKVIQTNAWRKVLKHCSEQGAWIRSRFERRGSREEWQAFRLEVLSKIFGTDGELLPIAAPVEEEIELQSYGIDTDEIAVDQAPPVATEEDKPTGAADELSLIYE